MSFELGDVLPDAETKTLAELREENARLTRERDALREALLTYGQHDNECNCAGDSVEHGAECSNCTCGLRETVKEPTP